MQLKNIEITGFRGFKEKKEFNLSAPVVILFGENGSGKSSLLNAIEWCFFGNKIIGKETGIRERIDWEVKNRNSSECIVKVEIEENGENYTLERTWVSKTKEKFSIISSDGNVLEYDEANKKLNALLKYFTFKDFMSSVYQHQEVIRFMLTQEPKDRNEAIDRLLGLSEYRNIIEGIDLAKIKPDELEQELNSLAQQIKAKVQFWQEQILALENELSQKGISYEKISDSGINRMCAEIKKELINFSNVLNINLSDVFSNISSDDANKFIEIGKKEITRLRSEMPDVKKQKQLYEERMEIEKNLSDYHILKSDCEESRKRFKEFVEKYGSLEQLKNKKEEAGRNIESKKQERKNISQLGSIIRDALDYLKSEVVTDKNKCPVCGSKTDNLVGHLEKEYSERFEEGLKKLDDEIKNLQEQIKDTEKLIDEAETLKKTYDAAEKSFNKLQATLRKKFNLTERDDIGDCLKAKEDEINRLEEELKKGVEKKQAHLTEIENKFTMVEKLSGLIGLKKKREDAREVEKTNEWLNLRHKAEELKKLKDILQNIVAQVKKTSQKDAQDKIDSIRVKVSENFKSLTQHPQITELQIEVEEDKRTGGNNYSFKDNQSKYVTPILSQGQLNSLALSVFLSIAETAISPFSFLIFDDPSQSLGKEEKEKLTDLLNTIAEKKNLIISTMDGELFESAEKRIKKQKTIYEFKSWNPHHGPEVIKRG